MRGPRRFRAARRGAPSSLAWGFFKWLFLYPFLFGVAVMVLQAVVMAAL